MSTAAPIWRDPVAFLVAEQPVEPMLFFAPDALTAQARRFRAGFDGLVTYAVKANSDPAVLMTLIAAGIEGFDVASPAEIGLLRRLAPQAALHYHNPAKSRGEIALALEEGVRTFSVDSAAELEKLADTAAAQGVAAGAVEVSVRYKLPVAGAAYDFGSKFGAASEKASALLARVRTLGMRPALTFHPGTQCEAASAWVRYIEEARAIVDAAGVRIERLNVGGGFPADLYGVAHALEPIFEAIAAARDAAFGDDPPLLVCEPGRAMVADCMALATQIKLLREDGAVFLNDGIYGGLDEFPVLGRIHEFRVLDPQGRPRTAPPRRAALFGPTCDSLDRLPGEAELPEDAEEGDYILFDGMGAYGLVTATRFNGYGGIGFATVMTLEADG